MAEGPERTRRRRRRSRGERRGGLYLLPHLLTTGNPGDRMGRTSHLSSADVDALVAYLETL